MNREQRREMRRRNGPNVVPTAFRCVECGEVFVHLEVWRGDDEPMGLPHSMMGCWECGGDLIRDETDDPAA